jgi:acetyl-CoA carboxylase biotin carboxyl carrier protein
METRELQRLIDFLSKSNLDEVNIETADLKLHIKRNSAPVAQILTQTVAAAPAQAAPVAASVVAQSPVISTPIVETLASNLIEIKSPMIGTFYKSAGPGKPNFVEVGDSISVGQVLCIVEAMKLFNEIESEISGKIVKVLVEDASPIEFDQPLYLVEIA